MLIIALDDVIKWKHLPCCWPLVWEIHRSPVNSPHKGQWRGTLKFSLICALNNRLSKQSWGWWFVTPSRSLCRHCNEFVLLVRHYGQWPTATVLTISYVHVFLSLFFIMTASFSALQRVPRWRLSYNIASKIFPSSCTYVYFRHIFSINEQARSSRIIATH